MWFQDCDNNLDSVQQTIIHKNTRTLALKQDSEEHGAQIPHPEDVRVFCDTSGVAEHSHIRRMVARGFQGDEVPLLVGVLVNDSLL